MSAYYTNYHTHTTYCDGNSTPAEIVREAVSLGMQEIGFSGHSYTSIDESYCMSREGTEKYRDEISALKEEYAGTIRILCGLERDYFADPDDYDWDYVIGSCHYIKKDGEYFPVDESEEILLDAADRLYGGDLYALISDYYAEVGDVAEKTECDIVGHFDLITKFNEGGRLFDETDQHYVSAWMSALDKLLPESVGSDSVETNSTETNSDFSNDAVLESAADSKSASGQELAAGPELVAGPLFEINTGAMSRGYRIAPYPSAPILAELSRRGAKVILSSDSHDKSTLLYGFEKAGKAAQDVGLEPMPLLGL